MAKYIKNTAGQDKTWVGQLVSDGTYYEIQSQEAFSWANNSALLVDIGLGDAVVAKSADGTQDLSDVASAINFLKDIDITPRDSDGSPLQRIKITTTGWAFQLHGLEFETSNLSSIYSKKVDESDFGFTTIKCHKADDSECSDQTDADTNCVKTVIDWEPNHDYEIVGGMLKMVTAPEEDLRLWVVGVPDVPAIYGGSKSFATNINLKFLGSEKGVRVDGRAPKWMSYDATNHTNKIRMVFKHSAGFKFQLHMIFEIFKA